VIETTSQVIKNDPKRVGAYLLRAAALRRQNRTERALADLAVATRLDPRSPHPRVIRAEIFKKQGRFDQAIAEATEAIVLDPNNAAAYSIRLESRRLIGDHDGAGQDAEELFRIDPTREVTSHPPERQQSGLPEAASDSLPRRSALRGRFEESPDSFVEVSQVNPSMRLNKPDSAHAEPGTSFDATDQLPVAMPRSLPRRRSIRRIRRSAVVSALCLCFGLTLLARFI
jgi:tetratricopeptide (TPR) repeat protein